MRAFRRFSLAIQSFILTIYPFEFMSAKMQKKTHESILRLAEVKGIDTKFSKRLAITDEHLSTIPKKGGVYFIYDNETLRYIGMSSDGLRSRLRRYLYVSNSITDENHLRIHELIGNKVAYFDYYQCPYPGWIENYELHKHKDRFKLWNKQLVGNRRE